MHQNCKQMHHPINLSFKQSDYNYIQFKRSVYYPTKSTFKIVVTNSLILSAPQRTFSFWWFLVTSSSYMITIQLHDLQDCSFWENLEWMFLLLIFTCCNVCKCVSHDDPFFVSDHVLTVSLIAKQFRRRAPAASFNSRTQSHIAQQFRRRRAEPQHPLNHKEQSCKKIVQKNNMSRAASFPAQRLSLQKLVQKKNNSCILCSTKSLIANQFNRTGAAEPGMIQVSITNQSLMQTKYIVQKNMMMDLQLPPGSRFPTTVFCNQFAATSGLVLLQLKLDGSTETY